jgi:ATP-binding cassette, subfamily B, bacterial
VVPDIADAPDAVDLPAVSSGGHVALREVYFRYPGTRVDALAGISFAAAPASS